ncbi:hypothetical protein, partial [Xanthomonas fragariae]
KWLGAIAAFVAGVIMINEGSADYSVNRAYGISIMSLGAASVALSFMILFGWMAPVAILMLILIAVLSVVVSLFKPDEVERWLDKAMHWGINGSGRFSSLEDQQLAITKFSAKGAE